MDNNKKGYWIYSVIAVVVGFALFAFWGYLIYDLILKLTAKDLSNNTVLQAFISLFVTVFLGGYFSKWLEIRNAKKLELFKTQRDISLKVIDCATALYYDPENTCAKESLFAETTKVKVYFDNEVLKAIKNFVAVIEDPSCTKKDALYEEMTTKLKAAIK